MVRGVGAPLIALTIAACASSAASTAQSGPVQIRELTGAERSLLRGAEEKLIGRCMARQGFTYQVVPQPQVAEVPEFPYGNDDVAWAGRYGYGYDLDARNRRALVDPNEAVRAHLSPRQREAYHRAFHGTDVQAVKVRLPELGTFFMGADGCLPAAQRELYGDLRRWLRDSVTARNIDALVAPKVVADTRYGRALDAWRSCMKGRGAPYQSPAAARAAMSNLRHGPQGRAARTHETRTAVADATCARASGLVAVANGLDRAYRAQAVAGRRAELSEYAQTITSALQRARRLTSSR